MDGDDTLAIQAAIDSAAEAGGGIVYLPPGDYVSGPLHLKSNITLHIEAGATLWATDEFFAYFENSILPSVEALANRQSLHTDYALINGKSVENVTISGSGRIHGQGKTHWWEKRRVRPYTIKIEDSSNVVFEDVTTIESMFHTFNFTNVEGLVIRGIRLFNEWRSPNTDGIHLFNSRYVSISEVNMYTGDDCVLTMGGTHDVTITNCRFSTPYGVLWISNGSRITMTNCTVTCQMIIKDIRKADDVIVSNIVADGEGRLFSSMGGPVTNLQMSNIIATGFAQGGWFRNAKNVDLSNIRITRATGTGYPALYNGLDFEGVEGLRLHNVSIQPVEEGPGLLIVNGKDVQVTDFEALGINDGSPVIRLQDVDGIYLNEYVARSEGTFLEISGENSADLRVGDLHLGSQSIQVGPEVKDGLIDAIAVEFGSIQYPNEITAAEAFQITVDLKSLDYKAGLFPLNVSVNGKLTARQWVWLEAGEQASVSLQCDAQYAAGDKVVQVNGETSKTIAFNALPAKAVVLAQTLKQDIVKSGDEVSLTAQIQNQGSETLKETLTLEANGQAVTQQEISIGPGEVQEISFKYNAKTPGLTTLSVDGKSSSTLKVYAESLDSTFIDLSFESIESGKIPDQSGLANHMMLAALADGKLPWESEGKFGGAVQFDGFTGYGEFASQWFQRPMTISMWVKMGELNEGSTAGRQMLLYAGEPKGTDGYGPEEETHLMHGTGNNFVWWSNAESPRLNLRAPIPDLEEFHHLVVVYDTEMKIYVNGELISTLKTEDMPDYENYADRVFFGRPTTERIRFFSGAIDEMQVYAEALNEIHIKTLYQRSSN